jgi:hypothetical protein|nr:MAG TPA: hypothetical protein [Caudoviricetes sp.]
MYRKTYLENQIAKVLREWGFSFVSLYTFKELRSAHGAPTGYSFGILDTSYVPYQLLLLIDIHYENTKEYTKKNYVLKEAFARKHQIGLIVIEAEEVRGLSYAQLREWLAAKIEGKEFHEAE